MFLVRDFNLHVLINLINSFSSKTHPNKKCMKAMQYDET